MQSSLVRTPSSSRNSPCSSPPEGPECAVPDQPLRWTPLVERIRSGDASAVEELYEHIRCGLRLLVARHVGFEEVDDRVHNGFLAVIQAIKDDRLQNPECLMGFVRTILVRQVQGYIGEQIIRRGREVDYQSAELWLSQNPAHEQELIRRERVAIARKVLECLPARDREILVRFYLNEESAETITESMGITPTQFRLAKSRAKQRFGELGRQKLQNRRRQPGTPK